MILKPIDIDVLKALINHQSISLIQLSEYLDISIINVRGIILRLQIFLKNESLGIIKQNKSRYSIELEKNTFTKKIEFDIINLNSNERKWYILYILIFEKHINLTLISKKLQINRATLNLDIKKIKKLLSSYNLSIDSSAWKGLFLKGADEDILDFKILLLSKFLLKKDFNQLSWDLYSIYINPPLCAYIEKQLYYLEENDFFFTVNSLKFTPGLYTISQIKSLLICLNLENNMDKFILEKINYLNKYYSLFKRELPFIELIQKRIEEIYKIKLNKDELLKLINILNICCFKKDFQITSFNNCEINEVNIPKSIILDFETFFSKNNIKIKKEDFSLFSLFIYQTVCGKYLNNEKILNILIIDSSTNNWIANNFKNEFKYYIKNSIIKIISIYQLDIDLINFENYEYIFFTSLIDKSNFFFSNTDNYRKIRIINFESFFNVNDFWGHLLFGY